MNVALIIERLSSAGIQLRVDGGNLKVKHPSPLTDEQRQYLKQHKPEIIKHLVEDKFEAVEERAAIMKYDGGLPRKEAEKQAIKAHLHPFIFTTTDSHGECTFLGHAETIEDARKALEHRFGKKLINVKVH